MGGTKAISGLKVASAFPSLDRPFMFKNHAKLLSDVRQFDTYKGKNYFSKAGKFAGKKFMKNVAKFAEKVKGFSERHK